MKFAAFGRTHWLLDSIHACVAAGHQLVLVGTCPPAPEYTVTEQDFAQLAKIHNCSFFSDPNINQQKYADLAKNSEAEIAISVNWLTLIGQRILDQFPHGVINAHMGDLPRFRGNAAPNWVILTGESKVVLTLHKMAADLDAGPILLQHEIPVRPDTYISEIYTAVSEIIPKSFVQALNGFAAGAITPKKQTTDPTRSLRGHPRLPRDSEIDWSLPAEQIARLARASAEPFAGAYSFIGAERITIWRAHHQPLTSRHLGAPGQVAKINRQSGAVSVLTGSGLLVIEEAETESHGRASAAAIISSHRTRLGMDVAGEIVQLKARLARLESKLRPHAGGEQRRC